MAKQALVAVIMGSKSDLDVMSGAVAILKNFAIPYEVKVVSAHRTPEAMLAYADSAKSRGLQIIIAGAGGAAHLPGMVAAITTLPVIGVPIRSRNSAGGWDSILSILQMPSGVPVATVALDGAENAGLLAVQILALADKKLATKLDQHKDTLRKHVEKQNLSIKS